MTCFKNPIGRIFEGAENTDGGASRRGMMLADDKILQRCAMLAAGAGAVQLLSWLFSPRKERSAPPFCSRVAVRWNASVHRVEVSLQIPRAEAATATLAETALDALASGAAAAASDVAIDVYGRAVPAIAAVFLPVSPPEYAHVAVTRDPHYQVVIGLGYDGLRRETVVEQLAALSLDDAAVLELLGPVAADGLDRPSLGAVALRPSQLRSALSNTSSWRDIAVESNADALSAALRYRRAPASGVATAAAIVARWASVAVATRALWHAVWTTTMIFAPRILELLKPALVVDSLVAIPKLFLAWSADLCGLPARPFIPLALRFLPTIADTLATGGQPLEGAPVPTMALFRSFLTRFGLGGVVCGSLGLICLSASKVLSDFFKNLGGGFYLWLGALDGVAQLLAFSGFAQLLGPNLAAVVESYPTNTGAWVWFQILGGLFCSASIVLEYMFKLGMIGEKKKDYYYMFMGHVIKMEWLGDWDLRPVLLSAAIFFRVASHRLLSGSAAAGVYGRALSLSLFALSFTPKKMLQALGPVLEAIASSSSELAKKIGTRLVTDAATLGKLLWQLINHPVLVALWSRVLKPLGEAAYDRVIEPLWRFASPWTLPVALAIMSRSCANEAHSNLKLVASTALVSSALAWCAGTAALSSIVLALDAGGRLLRGGSDAANPLLHWAPLATALTAVARVAAWPASLLHAFIERVVVPYVVPFARRIGRFALKILEKVVSPVLEAIWKFAEKYPLVAMPLVLAFNVGLLYSFSTGGPMAAALLATLRVCTSVVLAPAFVAGGWFWASMLALSSLRDAAGGGLSDATFALSLLLAVQVGAWKLVAKRLRFLTSMLLNFTGGPIMSIDDLRVVAGVLRDPRQCGQCGFGPVEKDNGCDHLGHHHHHGGVSNACPRCGWFVTSFSQWPRWDEARQYALNGPAGRAVFSTRTWGEACGIVRAASKALVIPYVLMRLPARVLPSGGLCERFGPHLSSFLALAYLLPWVLHHSSAVDELFEPRQFYRAREAGGNNNNTEAAPQDDDNDGTNCGAARRDDLGTVAPSDALAAVLTAAPASVFLREGDVCPVCLDDFDDRAVAVAAASRGAEAAAALQKLRPPVVGLRCGHVLHLECAEAAIRSANGRHVKCPLCREPVTVTGAVAGSAFG